MHRQALNMFAAFVAVIAASAAAAKVVHVGTGREFVCEKRADGAAFDIPINFNADANADVFEMIR